MSEGEHPAPVLAFAHQYAELGFGSLPLRPASKSPDLPSWKEYQKRRATDEELARWFANGHHGIAIVTGEVSGGLLVVDFDDRLAFEYCFTEWREMAQTTLAVRTARGVHLYVRLKGGGKPRKTTFRKRPDAPASAAHLPADLQGEGAYVVAPPSVHPSGAVYSFVGAGREPLEDTEAAVLARLKRHAEEWPFAELVLPHWKEGNRNSLVLGLAKVLHFNRGFDEDRTADVVRRICSVAGDTEVVSRVRSVRDTIAKGPERSAALTFLGEDLYGRLLTLVPKKPAKGRKREGDGESEEVRFASSAELDDGRIADEVSTADGPAFVVFNPRTGEAEVSREVICSGVAVRPLPLPVDPKQPKREIVVLPDGVEEYGSVRELLGEMERHAAKVYDAGRDSPVLAVWIAAALLSWIIGPLFEGMAERFAPILSAVGPSESGKGRALTLARAYFFRPFYFLKTTRTPSLFRALDGWGDGATLILNEADVKDSVESAEFIEYLNSRADGSPITRYSSDRGVNEFFSSFGSTVLALRRAYSDDGFASRNVPLHTETTARDIDLITPQEWWADSASLRRKLELFRLRGIAAARTGSLRLSTKVALPNVRSHRVREVFLGLQALEDSGERGILDSVRPQAEELERRLIASRATSPDGLILNAVYSCIDDAEWTVEPYATGWVLHREHTLRRSVNAQSEEGETESQALTLRLVARSMLGDAFSSTDVSKAWRTFGQLVEAQARIGGRRQRGVLVVSDPRRLEREFRRYVVDAKAQLGRFPGASQHQLPKEGAADTQLAGTSGTSGTPSADSVPLVPDVPAERTRDSPSGEKQGPVASREGGDES